MTYRAQAGAPRVQGVGDEAVSHLTGADAIQDRDTKHAVPPLLNRCGQHVAGGCDVPVVQRGG